MTVLDILKAGQDESLILRPSDSCVFSEKMIFVDLEPGKYDITKYIKEDEQIYNFLTHHDNDHLEGLRFLLEKWRG